MGQLVIVFELAHCTELELQCIWVTVGGCWCLSSRAPCFAPDKLVWSSNHLLFKALWQSGSPCVLRLPYTNVSLSHTMSSWCCLSISLKMFQMWSMNLDQHKCMSHTYVFYGPILFSLCTSRTCVLVAQCALWWSHSANHHPVPLGDCHKLQVAPRDALCC